MDHKKWWYVNAGLIIILSFAACERFGLPAKTLYVSDDGQNIQKNYVFDATDLDESKFEDGGHVITKRDASVKEIAPDHKSNITTKVRKALSNRINVFWAFYVCSMQQSYCFDANNASFVLCNLCTFKLLVFETK